MDQLPNDIFNYIRSHLRFGEMHRLRRVNKRWNDLDSVEKDLSLLHSDKEPTMLANVKKLRSLRDCLPEHPLQLINKAFEESSKTLQTLEFEDSDDFFPTLPRNFPKLNKLEFGDLVNQFLLREILVRSPKLQDLVIDIQTYTEHSNLPDLPHSPQVQSLTLSGDLLDWINLDPSTVVSNILQSFPQIKTFHSAFFNETYIIDFSLCPNIKSITFESISAPYYAHFINSDMVSLKSVDFQFDPDDDMGEPFLTCEEIENSILLWIQKFPRTNILFWVEEDDWEKWDGEWNGFQTQIEIQNLKLTFRRFISNGYKCAPLTKLLKLMSSIREFSFEIDTEMPKKEAHSLSDTLDNISEIC